MLIKLLEALAWKALCLAEKVAPESRLEGWLSDVWYAMDVKLRERKRRLAHRRWMELPYIVRGGLIDVNAHQPTEK